MDQPAASGECASAQQREPVAKETGLEQWQHIYQHIRTHGAASITGWGAILTIFVVTINALSEIPEFWLISPTLGVLYAIHYDPPGSFLVQRAVLVATTIPILYSGVKSIGVVLEKIGMPRITIPGTFLLRYVFGAASIAWCVLAYGASHGTTLLYWYCMTVAFTYMCVYRYPAICSFLMWQFASILVLLSWYRGDVDDFKACPDEEKHLIMYLASLTTSSWMALTYCCTRDYMLSIGRDDPKGLMYVILLMWYLPKLFH